MKILILMKAVLSQQVHILKKATLFFFILLVSVSCYANVNLETTGYDWLNFSWQEKTMFVEAVFNILEQKPSRNDLKKGIHVLDLFYYDSYKNGPKDKNTPLILEKPTIHVLIKMLNVN